MKTTIQILLAAGAFALLGSTASAASACQTTCSTSACAAKGSKVVILDGKKVVVADCKYTRGVRSVRMVKVRR